MNYNFKNMKSNFAWLPLPSMLHSDISMPSYQKCIKNLYTAKSNIVGQGECICSVSQVFFIIL